MRHLSTCTFVTAILITVLFTGFALADSKNEDEPRNDIPYSFVRAPYLHPKIVQDLTTWPSDRGDQIIAINLSDSQDSNRYFGEIRVRETEGQSPFVSVQGDNEEFGYRYVGITESGLHILYASDWTDGSGIFKTLLFVILEHDKGIQVDWDESVIRAGKDHLLIRKLGEIGLGDRWDGELRVEGDKLFIGKDRGWFTSSGGEGGGWLSYDRKDRTLLINVGL